jgi:enoyl-CoA hydratase
MTTPPFSSVRLDTVGKASVVTINRPQTRNALNNLTLKELCRAVGIADGDTATSCIVLTGAGQEAFCGGGDLKEMGASVDALAEHQGRGALAGLFQRLWSAGKPTIARVNGYCLAGGFGLALACDIVVATERSTFGAPEARVGLWPYMITLPLIRSMPPKQALRLMMTGERVDARRGAQLGFVTDLVSEDELDERIAKYADAFCAVSAQALALGRRSFYAVVDHDPASRLTLLHAGLGVALTMPDAAEGLAAFAEKRAPRWALASADQ